MRGRIFKLRVNDEERVLIASIAREMQRSQSDALRYLIHQASKEYGIPVCAQSHTPSRGAPVAVSAE